jgi:hypothetical protein
LDGYPVTAIGKDAFAGNGSLTSVTIPAAIADIREGAFLGCENLAFTVARDSAAERYAAANGIPIASETARTG